MENKSIMVKKSNHRVAKAVNLDKSNFRRKRVATVFEPAKQAALVSFNSTVHPLGTVTERARNALFRERIFPRIFQNQCGVLLNTKTKYSLINYGNRRFNSLAKARCIDVFVSLLTGN